MTGSFRFDLIDEPWIPVVTRDGTLVEVGLQQGLLRAHEFVEIAGDNPLETVALHRVLLAFLHRCFGPDSTAEWRRLQQQGQFDDAAVTAYSDRWRHRFDLFSKDAPFYQTAGLPAQKAGSIAKLRFQADNNPTLFDHAVASRPPLVRPSQAVRLLVAFQYFDTTGTKTSEVGQESAQAAPLVQSALTLNRGATLFETLLLNLHRYSPENAQPWTFRREADRPCWEHDEATAATKRIPLGYLDLLTWQSRRVLLLPERSADGEVSVPHVVIMAGYEFPRGLERRAWETMVAFVMRRKAQPGEPAYFPVGFREDRAVWRDSLAFMATASATEEAPKLARWLLELEDDGALPIDYVACVEVAGLATDKAKCLFWRHERIRLPTAVMRNAAKVERVREALRLAETAARVVTASDLYLVTNGKEKRYPSAIRAAAEALVCGAEDVAAAAKKDVQSVVRQLSQGAVFWGGLEVPFAQFLEALASDTGIIDDFGNPIVGTTALRAWRDAIADALDRAFTHLVEAAGTSARGLRAAAISERTFVGLKWRVLGTPSAAVQVAEVEG